MMRRVLLAALAIASSAVGAPARAADPAAAFDGNWLLRKDAEDGVLRALRIQGSSAIMLWQAPEGVLYARADWRAQIVEGGVQATFRRSGEAIEGDDPMPPGEAEILILRANGPDRVEVFQRGQDARWGVMERNGCDLALVWRDRSDEPPPGCAWLEIKGVGFDGLVGECVWNADWAADWDKVSRDAEGRPFPSACLITAPAAFAGGD